jgi:MFS family permease
VAESPNKLPLRLVFAMALASGLTPLNSTMLSVVLQPLRTTFHETEATLTQALVTTYLVTCIVMQAPGGKLGDELGHRSALAFGQGAFAVAAGLGMFAPSLGWLTASRILMATAGALIVPSATALLRNEIPVQLRGRAFGAFGASMALSAALGPLIGGQITSAFGWRAVFSVNLLVLPVSALLARESSKGAAASGEARRDIARRRDWSALKRFDYLGSSLLGAGLAALALGVRRGTSPSWALLGAAPLLLAAFVVVERRQRAPVVELGILRIPVFVASGGIIGLHNLAMYALLFELPSVCSTLLGAGANRTGLLLVAVLAPMVVLSPIAGRLTDRVGARSTALLGTGTALFGMCVLLATPVRTLPALIPGLIVFGLGLGLSSAPAQSSGMTAVRVEQSGVAAGMLSTMRYVGGVMGTLILAVLLAHSEDRELVRSAHRATLLIFVAALTLALGCALVLPAKHRT